MARYVKTDGTIQVVQPKKGKSYSLEELQEYVGGYIELLYLSNGGEVMVVNEEGKLHGLPVNDFATSIAYQPIVGDVLICRNNEIE